MALQSEFNHYLKSNKHDAAIQALFSFFKASHSDFEGILNVFMDQDRQLFHSVSVFQIFPPIN